MAQFINIAGKLINLDLVERFEFDDNALQQLKVYYAPVSGDSTSISFTGNIAKRAYEWLTQSCVATFVTEQLKATPESEIIAALKRTDMHDGTFYVYANEEEDIYQFDGAKGRDLVEVTMKNSDGDFRGVPYWVYRLTEKGLDFLKDNDPNFLSDILNHAINYGDSYDYELLPEMKFKVD